jgi:hypothetical protein
MGTRQDPTGKVKISFTPGSAANVYPSPVPHASVTPQCKLSPSGIVFSEDQARSQCKELVIAPNQRFTGGPLTVKGKYVPSSPTFDTSAGTSEVTWPHVPVRSGRITASLKWGGHAFVAVQPLEMILRSPAHLRICNRKTRSSALDDVIMRVSKTGVWNLGGTSVDFPIFPKAGPGRPSCSPYVRFSARVPTVITYATTSRFAAEQVAIVVP